MGMGLSGLWVLKLIRAAVWEDDAQGAARMAAGSVGILFFGAPVLPINTF